MSIVEAGGTTRTCGGCGEEFLDRSRTSPRTYCDVCRAGSLVVEPVRGRVKGRPFTVAHFESWARGFKLKSGECFRLDDYQRAFLVDLFARDELDRPVYSELWLVVPEGNGKTTFFALVALYVIAFKPEAWVPVAASARDQAVDLTYRICAGFVERNRLQGEYRLHPGYRSIVHRESKGAVKIFASDAASGDGVDPDLALIEELHRLGTMDLYETWAGKLEKSQGQLVIASTAGAPGSPFEELRDRIRQSADDVMREGCFVRAAGAGVVLHEYAVPEGGDCDDIALVKAANPSARITEESLAKKRAKPSFNPHHWARFTCNLPTREGSAAITEQEWHDAATAEVAPADAEWWVGLDVGWKWDTTAFVPLYWRDPEYRLFAPAIVIEPPRDGSSTDPDTLKAAFNAWAAGKRVTTIVMDTNRAEDLAAWFSGELGLEVIDRAQSNKPQADDYQRFMEALRQGWLFHSGDAPLRQHAFNAVTKILPDQSVRFDRPARNRRGGNQGARVIDALVAAAMVHSVRCEPPGPVYRAAGF